MLPQYKNNLTILEHLFWANMFPWNTQRIVKMFHLMQRFLKMLLNNLKTSGCTIS